MLEANPALTPQQVKRLLVQTARRLPHVESTGRAGASWSARAAVEAAAATSPKELRGARWAPRNQEDDPLFGGVGFSRWGVM